MTGRRGELIQSASTAINLIFRGMACKRTFPFQEYRLSPGQVRVLFIISHSTGMSIKELAKQLYVTSGAATQFVEGLVQLGLVVREEDERDRRIQRVHLSKKAEDHHREFQTEYLEQIEPMFQELRIDELEQLVSLLSKVEKPSFEGARKHV